MVTREQTVLSEDEDGVAWITLNRPDVLNALNDDILLALTKALREAERERSIRCLVITGSGRAFSSGQDLSVVRDRYDGGDPIDFGRLLRELYNPVIVKIRTIEKPVIACVNGVAAGAGCSLAIACDMRIAAESAGFVQAFVNVGLIPDAGSTFMLPRLIGVSRAMELAFTGRKVDAEEALRIGLVNRVVPDAQLKAETSKLAHMLAAMPTRAIGLAKRAINAAWAADLDAQLDYEAMLQAAADGTHDHREGVTAFFEKRPPRFKGE